MIIIIIIAVIIVVIIVVIAVSVVVINIIAVIIIVVIIIIIITILHCSQNDAADTVEVYEVCRCDNFGYLIGALYVYKGLLVVFGLFLAYESRNVKYVYINDSRFISIAMYIVVIVVGIGAPLSLVLSVHFFINPAYGLAVFMVILATMSCLLILFIPKVGGAGTNRCILNTVESQTYAINLFMRKCDIATLRKNKIAL